MLAIGALACAGCPPGPVRTLDPIPLEQSVRIVNENLAKIGGGLAASGTVTGEYVDRGGRRYNLGFGLDGKLSVIPPMHLRFDLQELGQTQILFGSNDEKYWLYVKADDDTYRWGQHAAVDEAVEAELPLRPDQLIEALGLNPLPETASDIAAAGMVQRVDATDQQLLFVRHDGERPRLTKEYWLARSDGRLARRIQFRDAMGRVRMDAQLSDYRALTGDGALLPHRVHVEWPLERAVLDYRISRWRVIPELGRDAAAFAPPHERGKKFKHVMCVDPGSPR